MPTPSFDRYYKHEELTQLLRDYEKAFPELVSLETIGESHEGRDIWMVTVTRKSTGEPHTKPAVWCDGNIHASELSASTAVLKILHLLCEEQPVTLDSRTYYLVPRLNPDGAEWALEDVPRIIRSSTRPYPFDEEDPYGLERVDIDGDGRILNMRVPDPNGPWKVSEEEPRLLKKRAPGETGGQYYRLLPEGLFYNFDGLTMRSRRIKEGLDLNRNFPSAWRQEHEQKGAGDYPASEPEVKAMVETIAKRKNICAAVHFHTFSGVVLRPPGRYPDDELESEDLWAFQEIGEKATEMSGYPTISIYHDFKYHPKEVISGDQDDWLFEQVGAYAFTVEIWSPQRQAGITDYKPIEWFRKHPHEHDIQLLKWSDEKLDGKGFIDWYEFEHPQLGKVELGGWDMLEAFRNPPAKFLEAEVTPLAEWCVWLGSITPSLELRDVQVENLGEVSRVRLAVQNAGWLPTAVTRHGEKSGLVRPVIGEIQRAGETLDGKGKCEPEWLVSGKLREEGKQLRGWSRQPASGFGWQMNETDDVQVFEWVVKNGSTYSLTARHDRAGAVSTEIEL
ncbi:MAG: M14 family metallopeptidase [Fimbriimonadaceae bacterium]